VENEKIDHVFTYNGFLKTVYRLGNIPVSMILALYIIPFLFNPSSRTVDIVFFSAVVVIFLIVNSFFFKIWRIVPFKIHALDDRLVCSGFFLSSESKELFYSDIENLKGGTFSGKFNGIMIAESIEKNIQIGFFAKLTNVRLLEAILINRAPQPVYDKVTTLLRERREELTK